jgi:hypothetical protein
MAFQNLEYRLTNQFLSQEIVLLRTYTGPICARVRSRIWVRVGERPCQQ